ncbi:MAG: PG0541 family transporter-associated protein [Candidatus Omnitrophota bacterium]
MKKMILVSYNEAIEEEVGQAMKKSALKNYTKINGAFGRGEASGTHLGDDIWPGRNNIILIAADEAQEGQFLLCVRELRNKLGKEGIKAFVWGLEEIT